MRTTLCTLLSAALFIPAGLIACSAVSIVKNGKVIVGANNDYSYSAKMQWVVEPARDGLFGRVCLSMETVPGWRPAAMRCMNDQGLALMHANTPRTQTPYDPDKPHFRHNFLEKIISECATVKQAIAMISAYTLPAEHGAFIHVLLADSSGNGAIVEWVDNELKILRPGGSVQFMTNHLLSKPETAGGPNARYARGVRMLPGITEPTVPAVLPLMKEISVYARIKGQQVGTVETSIWDLAGRKIHLYYKRDFDHPLVVDFDRELARGPRMVPLDNLFPNPVPYTAEWRDENGPVARKPVNP